MIPNALTAAVRSARRGLRRDVRGLCEALEDGRFLLPLARDAAAPAEGNGRIRPGALTGGAAVSLHHLEGKESGVCLALFTQPEFLPPFENGMEWTTDGGPLRCLAVSGREALTYVKARIEAGEAAALLINPFDEQDLELSAAELKGIVDGAPIPLLGYLGDLPALDDEELWVWDPEPPPPEALREALVRLGSPHGEIRTCEVYGSFNTDRDLEPHLLINVRTAAPQEDYREVAERVLRALARHIPPPGYVRLTFNRDFARKRPEADGQAAKD